MGCVCPRMQHLPTSPYGQNRRSGAVIFLVAKKEKHRCERRITYLLYWTIKSIGRRDIVFRERTNSRSLDLEWFIRKTGICGKLFNAVLYAYNFFSRVLSVRPEINTETFNTMGYLTKGFVFLPKFWIIFDILISVYKFCVSKFFNPTICYSQINVNGLFFEPKQKKKIGQIMQLWIFVVDNLLRIDIIQGNSNRTHEVQGFWLYVKYMMCIYTTYFSHPVFRIVIHHVLRGILFVLLPISFFVNKNCWSRLYVLIFTNLFQGRYCKG